MKILSSIHHCEMFSKWWQGLQTGGTKLIEKLYHFLCRRIKNIVKKIVDFKKILVFFILSNQPPLKWYIVGGILWCAERFWKMKFNSKITTWTIQKFLSSQFWFFRNFFFSSSFMHNLQHLSFHMVFPFLRFFSKYVYSSFASPSLLHFPFSFLPNSIPFTMSTSIFYLYFHSVLHFCKQIKFLSQRRSRKM